MPKVFVSYRRELHADIAGRIYDRLVQALGEQSVFIDVDSIPYGVDFRTYLTDWVSQCDVFLAIVGKGWVEVSYDLRREPPSTHVLAQAHGDRVCSQACTRTLPHVLEGAMIWIRQCGPGRKSAGAKIVIPAMLASQGQI